MSILSVQSHVCFGHVGNRAAVFPLQRLGFEVWPVNTVNFSNHTGYGTWAGEVVPPERVAALIAGVLDRVAEMGGAGAGGPGSRDGAPGGADSRGPDSGGPDSGGPDPGGADSGGLGACRAVLSGYLGAAPLGAAIVEAVARVRAANPDLVYCCDPVMGDQDSGLFVQRDIPAFLTETAVPAADIVTPNLFELELLSGGPIATLEAAVAAARALCARGPRLVLVTSLRHATTPADRIEMLAVTPEAAWRVATPYLTLDPPPGGLGDATAALFLAHWLRGAGPRRALEACAAAIHELVLATQARGGRELALIEAQDRLVAPRRAFAAEAVG